MKPIITAITDIFFDLDHTLWDFDKNSAIAFEEILRVHHPKINQKEFIFHYVRINKACWQLFQNNYISHDELRIMRLQKTFDALNYTVSNASLEIVAKHYMDLLTNNNHLLEGANEVLLYLSKKYKLHIITNGFATIQLKKLKKANIFDYFCTITNADVVGEKKPNPLIFRYALQSANAKKETSIMIGDCLQADIQGALSFGMQAVFLNLEREVAPNNIQQITKLTDLLKIL